MPRIWMGLLAGGLLGILFFGCSNQGQRPSLGVDFNWPVEMKSCFDTTSPEIQVSNVPEGVRRFSVSMFDRAYSMDHGGGEVDNTGTGRIPMGALSDYKGPCADLALNGPGSYEITVKALDEKGRVLAKGKKTKSWPEQG